MFLIRNFPAFWKFYTVSDGLLNSYLENKSFAFWTFTQFWARFYSYVTYLGNKVHIYAFCSTFLNFILVVFCNFNLIYSLFSPQNAILHASPAVGRGLCPVLPVPPKASCCPLASALPGAPLVTMTTVIGSVKVGNCWYGHTENLFIVY